MAIVTNIGLESIARMINGVSAPSPFTYMAIGSGSTAEAATQTALVTENVAATGGARSSATCTYTATGISSWVHTFSFTGSNTLREIGIFNASSSGNMLIRHVLAADKSYSSGESVEITITNTVSRSS